MNSALKPVLPQPGVPQPSGQSSPAKGNVANANHAVGHPQGAQNSLHHPTNNVAVQNLSHHVPNPPQLPAHSVPSMAPVSANMAQMAQNMSHHGNLSHISQNSMTPANTATSPTKSATTSAPLSLVQDKATPPLPLALTRTPDKKDSETNGQSNGAVEAPKPSSSAVGSLKPQNPEPNKDKQDIAKTSPSTPKPPEKPISAPSTPQKTESANPVIQAESQSQVKAVTGGENAEKSPSKPVEPKVSSVENKPAVTADVAPSQSDKKLVPEAANENQQLDKPPTPQKQESTPPATAKAEVLLKSESTKPEVKKVDLTVESTQNVSQVKKDELSLDKVDNPNLKIVDKPNPKNVDIPNPKTVDNPNPKNVDNPNPKNVDNLKSEGQIEKLTKTDDKAEDKKTESRVTNTKPPQKSTMKLATVTTPIRKRRQPSPSKASEGTPIKKSAENEITTPGSRAKRNRTQVQLYQSPTPELTMATKLSASAGRSTPTKPSDDKLIVFYKNEYLAVRNTEGGFYVCQALQNVYRATRKIKIRWLSQDKTEDPSGQTYKPDFYDTTDKECVLTTLSLSRSSGSLMLRPAEQTRVLSILKRALSAEQSGGVTTGEEGDPLNLTEEHPDGLDLSLYKDESQLDKKSRKRNSSKSSPRGKQDGDETAKDETPSKKAKPSPKRSPKSIPKPKVIPINKRGSTPSLGNTSKTATAVLEKADKVEKPKPKTPVKKGQIKPVKIETLMVTPTRTARRATKENKPSPIVPTPSTSTGKTTRTPRKPPAKK